MGYVTKGILQIFSKTIINNTADLYDFWFYAILLLTQISKVHKLYVTYFF